MFTPGQHVICNGKLYTYGRDATSIGEAPRIDKNGKPYQCAHALVTPVGGSGTFLVRRASLQAAGPASASPTKPADAATVKPTAPADTAATRPETAPPAPTTTHRPTALDLIKAGAFLDQAERLEAFAKALRAEARALRGET